MNRLAASGIPALLAIIMLTSQSASANNIGGFDCFGQVVEVAFIMFLTRMKYQVMNFQ